MARWARNPPSTQRVLMWAGVIALCLGIAGFELLFGWPEALSVNRGGVPKVPLASP
ncbi:MAG: hypothetical protein Q8K20_09965 [Gemmobacter sp.]|nr:hypothetical protein [Gemmobacter sp.]